MVPLKEKLRNVRETRKIREWIITLIERDLDGNAKILRSFTKEAKDSTVKKQPAKKKDTKPKPVKHETEISDGGDLFG